MPEGIDDHADVVRPTRHFLRGEFLDVLRRRDDSSPTPMRRISPSSSRLVEMLAIPLEVNTHEVRDVLVPGVRPLREGLPDEVIGNCAPCDALMHTEEDVLDDHIVELEELEDLEPLLAGERSCAGLDEGPVDGHECDRPLPMEPLGERLFFGRELRELEVASEGVIWVLIEEPLTRHRG